MNEQSLYGFYKLGWDYRTMYKGYAGNNIKDVTSSLQDFETFIISHDMAVTKQAIKHDFKPLLMKVSKIDENQIISQELTKEIIQFATSIEKTLDSELTLRYAYILSKKRLGLDKLLKNPSQLFSIDIFNSLSPISKTDFTESGKCIVFERYTAAAFHILRGTEQVLKEYYLFKIKRNRIDKLLWYNMTTHLKGKRGVPDSLIAVLDSIREDFRNPTAHPEKNYGEDEVQSLFTHCIDVVTRLSNLKK